MKACPLPRLFCFGLGYTAQRLGRTLLAAGWRAGGTVRTAEKAAALGADGFETAVFRGDAPMEGFEAALADTTHLLATIPPNAAGDPALIHHAGQLAMLPSLTWVGYLSTPAVYGDRNGDWVNEDTPTRPESDRGHRRLAAEQAWQATFADRPAAVQVFRVSGIYGPGRNVANQVLAGTGRRLDKPGHVFNRIHVDDIGLVLRASIDRPRDGGIYLLADNEAAESRVVIEYAADSLGVDPPPLVPFETADLSPMARSFYAECKRLSNRRIIEELGVRLAYPTYREGMDAIIADLRAGGS